MTSPEPPPAGRNASCPCGSGRKWKRCCGRPGAAPAADAVGGAADRGARRTSAAGAGPAARARGSATSPRELVARAERAVAAGSLAAAERLLAGALQAAPENTDALLLLGRVRVLDGRHAAAVRPLAAAAERRPRDPVPRLTLAAAHRAARRPDEAERALQDAARVDPRDPRPWSLLASLRREQGRLEAAREDARRARTLAPDDAMVAIVEAGILNDGGEPVAALDALAAHVHRPPTSPSLRGELEAERGRALERLGRDDEAWEAFLAANRAQSADPAVRSVDRGRAAAWIDAYARHLPPGAGPVAEPGPGEPPPLDLLVGFARTGTTMLEQMLAAHPEVCTTGERPVVQRLKRTLGGVADDPDAFARHVARLDAPALGGLRRRLAAIAREEAEGDAPRIVHKHPMDAIELPLLERLVPDARVLVTGRDPRDVCVSCLKQRFVPNMTNVHFLEPGATVALQERVIDAWIARRDALRCRWREVWYETVVADPEAEARAILDFLDLPWNDAVLAFQRQARDRWISTPSAGAVRGAVHRRAVGGWRRYAGGLASVRPRLDRLARRLGYPVEQGD